MFHLKEELTVYSDDWVSRRRKNVN